MTEREKVTKGLERCIEKLDTVVNKTHGFNCTACPYFRKCDSSGYLVGLPLMRDTLALLKAQEPRVMTLEELIGIYNFRENHSWVYDTPPYLYLDNRAWIGYWVSWSNIVGCLEGQEAGYKVEKYGERWRCWTTRPTDAQREAVKWE